MYRNYLRDEGAVVLANENEIEKIEEPDLAQNEIGDEGLLALSNSKKLPNLVSIALDNNLATRDGRQSAKSGILFRKCQSVNL